MVYRNSQAARRALIEIATAQGGYFTAKQAATAGYGNRHLDYHARTGNIERVQRGLYRLPEIPVTEHDQLIRLSLWSRGRDDRPQAVVSHETALGVHGLGDLLPERVHLTVPSTFRKPAPRGCRLHKAALTSDDIEQHEGFAVTTPLRTVVDISAGETVTQDHLNEIVRQALGTGQVRRQRALSAADENELRRLSLALDAAV